MPDHGRRDDFEQVAVALTAVMVDPLLVKDDDVVNVRCSAPSDDLLLVDWLNSLVYEMATRGMLFKRFHVAIQDHALRATAHGETLEPGRHKPAVEIKGATYTGLALRQEDDAWIAECIVDV